MAICTFTSAANVLAVGDAAFTIELACGGWWTGGWIWRNRWRLATDPDRLREQENAKIVPAHGPVLSYADIAAQVEMYGTIYDRLNRMLNKGLAVRRRRCEACKGIRSPNGGNPGDSLPVFQSLWAYVSPDA